MKKIIRQPDLPEQLAMLFAGQQNWYQKLFAAIESD